VILGADEQLLGTAVAITADGTLQVKPSADATGMDKALVDVRAGDVIHVRS
jgi:hypothetical protein